VKTRVFGLIAEKERGYRTRSASQEFTYETSSITGSLLAASKGDTRYRKGGQEKGEMVTPQGVKRGGID